MKTEKLYVDLYGWHPMSPTMHKILLHGAVICENAILPIGQLSEEAAEARNKHFRSYRLNFARKFSREECNLDIYHRLLMISDPLISALREKKEDSFKIVFAGQLLVSAEPNTEVACDTCVESDDEDISFVS